MKTLNSLTAQVSCINRTGPWPRNVILTGANGTGKTSHIRAIQFLISGEWGGYKQPGDIAKFAKDGNLTVYGGWDGISLQRSITTKDGKSSSEINIIPYTGKDRLREQEAYIAQQLGSFAPMLDLAAFVNLSDAERVKFLFGMMDEKSVSGKVEEYRTEALAKIAECPEEYASTLHDILDGATRNVAGIENFLFALNEGKKATTADLKHNEQAARQFQQELQQVNAPLTAISTLQIERSDYIGQRDRIKVLKAKSEERSRTYQNLQKQLGPKRTRLQAERLLVIGNGQLDKLSAQVAQKADLDLQRNETLAEIATLETGIAGLRERIAQQEDICNALRDGVCPYAGCECETVQSSFDAADTKRTILLNECNAKVERNKELHHREVDIQAKLKVNEGVEKEIDANTRRVLAIQELQREINDLERQCNEIGEIAATDELDTQIQALTIHINERDTQIVAASRRDNLHGLIDKNLTERRELEETLDFLKDLIDFAGPNGLLGKLIQETIGEAFTAKVQEILSCIVKPPYTFRIEYQRNDRMVLDFIFDNKDFDVLSNGEKALVGMAIQAALIEIADPPFKLLALDNLEALDEENRQGLIEAVDRIKDRFSNCVLAGCCDIDAPEGWERIEL